MTMRSTILALALVAAVLPVSAGAQSLADYDYDHLTFRGIGVSGGYLWSDRIENTEHYSLRVDLGYLGPGIRIVPSVEYWRSELSQEELDEFAGRLGLLGSSLAPIEWSDLSLSVDAHFVWSAPLGLYPYLGAGLGLHALNGQGQAVDDTFVESLLDNVSAGATGIAGIEFDLLKALRVFTEGRYTAMNSIRYVTVRAGVQIMFSQGNVEVGAAPVRTEGRGL